MEISEVRCRIGAVWQAPIEAFDLLEILTLQCEMAWDSGSETRDIIMKRRIVERSDAPTLYGAIEDARGPAFNIEGLELISRKHKCFIVLDVPDNAKYVKRMRRFKATRFLINIFTPDISCVIHRLHRIFVLAVREDDLSGHGHAINCISTHTP